VAAFSDGDMVDVASADDVRGMVTLLSSTAAPDGIPSQALLQVRNVTSSMFNWYREASISSSRCSSTVACCHHQQHQ
jgi:hypothetical protein